MHGAFAAAALMALALFAGLVAVPTTAHAETSTQSETSTQYMFRLYNPNSGEHFYTASTKECDNLDNIGWNYEGIAWTAPVSSNTPVYRLYNPNVDPTTGSGEHHYTTDANERNTLIAAGWTDEGIGWYSDDEEGVPLYRQYNPNAYNCNHNYTADANERDTLIRAGWRDEGIAWYGVSSGSSSTGSGDGDGGSQEHVHKYVQQWWAYAYYANGVSQSEYPYATLRETSYGTQLLCATYRDAALVSVFSGYNYGYSNNLAEEACSCGAVRHKYDGEETEVDHLCSFGTVHVSFTDLDGTVGWSVSVPTHRCPTCGGIFDYANWAEQSAWAKKSSLAANLLNTYYVRLEAIWKDSYEDAEEYTYKIDGAEASYAEVRAVVGQYADACGWD